MRIVRWCLVLSFLFTAMLAFAYFYSPQIITRIAFEQAALQTFKLKHIELQRPGIHGIHIDHLAGTINNVQFVARDIDVIYDLRRLLAQPVDAITVDDLQVRVTQARTSTPSPTPSVAPSDGFDPAVVFSIVPQVTVRMLVLEVVGLGLVGEGSFRLDSNNAQFDLSAVEPELARNLSIHGQVSPNGHLALVFSDKERPDTSFVNLSATPVDSGIDASVRVDLSGYPLGVVAGLLNFPGGTGRVQGKLSTKLDSYDVAQLFQNLAWQNLELEGEYEIDWKDDLLQIESLRGKLNGSLTNAELTFSAGSIALPQSAVQFTVHSGTTVQYVDHQISIGTGMTATFQAKNIDLQSDFSQTEIDLQGPSIRTDAKFDLSAYGLDITGSMAADVVLVADDVQTDLTFSVANLKFPLHMDYNISSRRGSIAGTSQHSTQNLLHTMVQNWPYDFEVVDGDVGVDLQVSLHDGDISGQATIELDDSTLQFAEYEFSDTNTSLNLVLADGGLQLLRSDITVGGFDFGLALRDAQFAVSWQDDLVDVHRGQFSLLGGSVTVAPTQYDIETNSASLDLTLVNLDLAQILALEGDDIKGTGRLYGTLPVRVNAGAVSMANGQIRSGEGGGVIQLSPEFGIATGQVGIDFALKALADFNYEKLTAVADFEENGDLQLAVSLQGNNPAVEKGRAILYNLNISENVYALMEALNAQRGITEQVERRVLEQSP